MAVLEVILDHPARRGRDCNAVGSAFDECRSECNTRSDWAGPAGQGAARHGVAGLGLAGYGMGSSGTYQETVNENI